MPAGRERKPEPPAHPEPAPGPDAAGPGLGIPARPPAAALTLPDRRSPFGHALLEAAARDLSAEDGALEAFARRHFPDLAGPRDRAAALLCLGHAARRWLPAVPEPQAEALVRGSVDAAVDRAARLEEHWQARVLAGLLPCGDGVGGFEQVEGRLEAERLIARAGVAPEERALLRALAAEGGGWSAVRSQLPTELRATDEAFYRWQRAARQRWQRAFAHLLPPS